MFSFLRRIKEVFTSSKIIEKGDAPEDFLNEFIKDMGADISEAEQATRKMIAEEKLLLKRITQAKEKIVKRENQAVEALQSGKEDLARRALEDKSLISQELQQLEELYKSTSFQVEQLRERLKGLKAYYQDLQLKQEAFVSKTNASTIKNELPSSNDHTKERFLPTTSDVEVELKKLKASINNKK